MKISMSLFKTNGSVPKGTINITSNGQHDVKKYAVANVNVPAPTIKTSSATGTLYCPPGSTGSVVLWFTGISQMLGIAVMQTDRGYVGNWNIQITGYNNITFTAQNLSAGEAFSINISCTVYGY